jgi:polar amino acid transport system substrate-binding protein
MFKAFAALAVLLSSITCAMAESVPQNIVTELAPSGRLRVAINFGNPVLAQKDAATGEPRGVSAALARELAQRLGVPIDFVTFDTAGKVFDALQANAWDVAFLAIDPVRAAGIDFTAPYVLIEGIYLVPSGSPLRTVEDVDRAGVRVAVGHGSAYDLYLTRALKQATVIREPSSAAALDAFLKDQLEAHPDVRVIPGRFMSIEQAMGTPKGRAAGVRYLRQFVEEMKLSGFVAKALALSGQSDAAVAPPAP